MELREVMTRNIETVDAGVPIRDVARRMRALDVGVIPVVMNDRIAGVITDRDICIRCVADNHHPERTTAAEMMTPDVRTIREHEDVRRAADLMRQERIRRLVVVDDNDRAVGIVSLGDLAVHCGERDLTASTLEEISKPANPMREG